MTASRLSIGLVSGASILGIGALVAAFVINPWYLGVCVGLGVVVLGGFIAFQRDSQGVFEGKHGETTVNVSDKGVAIMLLGLVVLFVSFGKAATARGEESATNKIPSPPTAGPVPGPSSTAAPVTTTVTVTAGPTGPVSPTTSTTAPTSTGPSVTTSPSQRGPWYGDNSTIALTVERCSVSKVSGILACSVRLENNSDNAVFLRKSGFIAVDDLNQSHRLDAKAKSELIWDAEDGYYPTYTFPPNTTRAGSIVLGDRLPPAAKQLQLRFEVGRDGESLSPTYDVVSANVSLEGLK